MDYTKVPANLINKYLWDLAQGTVTGSTKIPNTIFGVDVATYTYRPFFPVSENAGQLNEGTADKPFILYQSMPRMVNNSDYFLKAERMIYTVVAPMPQVLYVSNFIAANTAKFDVSAAEINKHLGDSAVIFDSLKSYSVNLQEESTKFGSTEPRYETEIIVDFEYRRSDLE
jgi:hypothetical protein